MRNLFPGGQPAARCDVPAVRVCGSYFVSTLPGLYCCTLIDEGPPRSRIHDRFVFLTLTAGEAVVKYRGQVHTLRPGAVLLVEPGEVHRDLSKSAYCAEMVVIHPDLLAELRGPGPNRYLGPAVTNDPAFLAALLKLVRVVSEQSAADKQERSAGQLVSLLAPYWTHRQPQLEPALVARARRLFVEEPDLGLSLQLLATRLHCAPTYLCRVFTDYMGVGPHGYQVHCRLLVARAHIEAGKTVAEAAVLTGFTDESHLHRHFRRRFAAAPGRYHRALALK
jgi:AraC-like DNA-binding protein